MLTSILVFGFVVGLNWKSFTIFFDNRDAMMEGNEWVHKTNSLKGLSEYMGENPEKASVVSRVLSEPDSAIFFNENTPRIMGTTSNLFILIAYAIEIENGVFDEHQQINWQDVNRYQLPDVDESVQNEAYRAADSRGWFTDGAITLTNALHLLAEYNSLALSDYLWWQLDSEMWIEIPERFELDQTEMPLPFSGLYIAISPGIQELTNEEIISRYSNISGSDWREKVTRHSDQFVSSQDYRQSVKSYMQSNRLGNTFMQERDAMILFPKAVPSEITTILEMLVRDQLVNPAVSERLKNYLRWPMEKQDGIDRDFNDYGALYDNRMGLLAGIDFGTSEYTGDLTVQALFLDQLPIGFWFHASGGHMHQDLMQRLIFDPAMIQQMKYAVQN